MRAVLLIVDDSPASPWTSLHIQYDLYLIMGMAKYVCRNAQSGGLAIAMAIAKAGRLRGFQVKQTSRCCSVHDESMALYVSWWCRKAHALRASCRPPRRPP